VLSDDDEVRAMSKSLARVAAAVEPQIARSHQCAGAVDGAAVGAVAGATTGRGRANSRN
jgi:outer membrane lipoprotein SlyB